MTLFHRDLKLTPARMLPINNMDRAVLAEASVFTVCSATDGSLMPEIIRTSPRPTARMQGCVVTFFTSVFLSGASVKQVSPADHMNILWGIRYMDA